MARPLEWLSLIARKEQPQVNAEVRWLGELLSARGMPQWLLERHLAFLHEELAAAVPENRERYERLLNAAAMLRNQRRAQLPERDFLDIAEAFHRRVGPELTARLPNMGALLASAVADEAAGVARAVEQIEPWATDPSRFPAEWIVAVREAIRSARSRVTGL